ncbi:hypothetical protein [Lacticaseibacillus sharpeae]|uniref:Uncharacterized protein n=1 Tax=Lacticaseibacillus sharpeae JCM 1186 = DSM 20505 TaxID=1291052 RepID=A0A0R1ZJX6_9LACO|nr:hypothetical protein [Lacticaseibacillus sharpeae]KRM54831.1 hypothetical protein FC18_GL002248 [Lacticaseibacillus sharpeae JCM 1186 = DSM 20505]
MLFKPKAKLQCAVTPNLADAGLHLMYTPDARQAFTHYVRTMLKTTLRKTTGVIGTDSAIVPYLTVRANIYIDGPEHDLFALPAEMRTDFDFLNGPANALGALQRLYIEFFRSVLAGKKYIIIADIFSQLSGPEAQRFLTVARDAAQTNAVSVILLTADRGVSNEYSEISQPFVPEFLAQ